MAQNRITKIIAVVLLTMKIAASVASPVPPAPSRPVRQSLSVDQQDLVDWAMHRFAVNSLELPSIEIEFSPSTIDCMGTRASTTRANGASTCVRWTREPCSTNCARLGKHHVE